MTRERLSKTRGLAACMALFGALSAFAAADIAWKYDTSGRDGTIVEPTAGSAQPFVAFDSTSKTTAAWDLSLPSVLVQYFSVFESNVAEILTNPPGFLLLVK